MPEQYNQQLMDRLKSLQRQVNSTINAVNDYTEFRTDLTATARTTRIADVKTNCGALGIDTTDWLGNDEPIV